MFFIYNRFQKSNNIIGCSNVVKYNYLFFTAKSAGIRRSLQGAISSPKYPGSYESNMDCEYRIIVDFRRRIILNFDVVSLKRRYPSIGVLPDVWHNNDTYDDTLSVYDVDPFNNTSKYYSHTYVFTPAMSNECIKKICLKN